MKYDDLPPDPRARFLYCPTCGARYSAFRGDYWLADPQEVILCVEDGAILELVREQRWLVKVKA